MNRRRSTPTPSAAGTRATASTSLVSRPRAETACKNQRQNRTAAQEFTPRRPPRRVAIIYGAGAVVVIAWAAYLGVSLPDRNVASHWNVAWVGLDGLIFVALSFTAWRAGHNDRRVVIPAVATATLLAVDAWMDVTTAARPDLWQSILLAAGLELPLAALSLLVARRALDSLTRPSNSPRNRHGEGETKREGEADRLASRTAAVTIASRQRPGSVLKGTP